ncbi:hypothetical protein EOE65_15490 [Neptunomonas marina]|uniref:Haem-binding uptake Tiki superfamily ChaN domain-containing protein n=2 Tax=Neptunomonas marina TaxID=1815562 RepID=A0A437Q4Z4_9GAMM|nr:hypothetical protein EOE65_15490 [Neptunomonas marina]
MITIIIYINNTKSIKMIPKAHFTPIRERVLLPLFTSLLMLFSGQSTAANYPHAWLSPLLQEHPLSGMIVNLQTSEPVDSAQLIEQLNAQTHVLIGENHDNPDHHMIESFLIKTLSEHQPRRAVFEMLSEENIDAARTLLPEDSAEAIYEKLNWKENRWPWEDYRGAITQAVRYGKGVVPGNISRKTIRLIYKSPSALDRPDLATVEQIPESATQIIAEQIISSHCGMIKDAQLSSMNNIQLAKDARMAHVMAGDRSSPSLLIAGSFHTRKDVGVPLHLTALSQQSVSLALVEVAEDKRQIADYLDHTQADFAWFTPRQPREDHCEKMREMMNKKPTK